MFIKNIGSVKHIVVIFYASSLFMVHLQARNHASHHSSHTIDITPEKLRNDLFLIKKYITDKVSNDLKKAKRWGKGAAKAFAGISYYAFDAIPFEFFSDNAAIDAVFKRLEEGAEYIRNAKETFKKNYMVGKKKLNQSQLAEFLYNLVIENIQITDDQRILLKREPLKMDEFVRRGIVKREEYMYFTLLNFVVRYYLEQEFKK